MSRPSTRVAQLWRYPVKSLGGEQLDAAAVGPLGVEGDRRWAICERPSGKALTAKRVEALLHGAARTEGEAVVLSIPGGVEVVAGDPAADAAVSEWLDLDVTVRRAAPEQDSSYEFPEDPFDDDSPATEIATLPGAFFDATPLHLLTTASLEAFGLAYEQGVWDVRRFRPNLLLEVDPDSDEAGVGFVEEGWLGQTVRLGAVSVMVVSPCPRCAMTTRSQPELDRDVEILRTVNAANGGSAGVYGVVTAPGTVRVGDAATVDSGTGG